MTSSIRISLFLAAASCIPAQQISLHLDPAKTNVEYSVNSTLHTVHGTFHLKRGDLTFDTDTGQASGELVVDAASGESGSSGRDHRMNGNILEAARYPEIVFRPDHVEGKVDPAGHSQVQLHGTFAIHGSSHEMAIPVSVDAAGGEYKAIAKFEVPYIKWGLKNPSTFVLRVSDKVDITVETAAR